MLQIGYRYNKFLLQSKNNIRLMSNDMTIK
jgi:hypothetical protein